MKYTNLTNLEKLIHFIIIIISFSIILSENIDVQNLRLKNIEISYLNYSLPISQLLDFQTIDRTKVSIIINKSDYILTILYENNPIKSYPVVFGFNPIDDKLKQGDGCTPEGVFKIHDLYPHQSWSKFIWLDYPTTESWVKHNRAKEEGTINSNAGIGGEIGIHGVPTGMDHLIDNKTNWTLGCISLKNKDINELFSILQKETKIIIVH